MLNKRNNVISLYSDKIENYHDVILLLTTLQNIEKSFFFKGHLYLRSCFKNDIKNQIASLKIGILFFSIDY